MQQTDNTYILSSPALSEELISQSFEPDNNANVRAITAQSGGRNTVWHITAGNHEGILRHYYRGGLAAKLSRDSFLWTGINRCRSVVEYRLLELMQSAGLSVPEPMGARVQRYGFYYTCDLITRYIPNTKTFGNLLTHDRQAAELWNATGSAIKALHDNGIWHSDLNAHNILVAADHQVTIIDFDRCKKRNGDSWKQSNLERLKRSLDKLKRVDNINYSETDWQLLLDAYNR